MAKIQPVDPRARRRSLYTVGIGLVAGLALLAAVEFWQDDIQSGVEAYLLSSEQTVTLPIVLLLAVTPMLVLAVYLFRIGQRIVIARRFPPPGMALSRDTPILEGRAAVWRGRLLQIIAVILLIGFMLLPLMVWLVIHRILT